MQISVAREIYGCLHAIRGREISRCRNKFGTNGLVALKQRWPSASLSSLRAKLSVAFVVSLGLQGRRLASTKKEARCDPGFKFQGTLAVRNYNFNSTPAYMKRPKTS
jgi:hypothetical protein